MESFLFNVKDWLSDFRVKTMTPAQKGYYIDLLAYMWNEGGSLPNNNAMLMGLLSGISEEDLAVIRECLFVDDGYIYQKRMSEEWEKLKAYRDSRSQNAQKRWEEKPNGQDTPPPKPSREDRLKKVAEEFKMTLNAYAKKNPDKYSKQMYREFFEYWGIPENTRTPKKLVFETNKSWNLPNRLSTWYKNTQKGSGEDRSTKGDFKIDDR